MIASVKNIDDYVDAYKEYRLAHDRLFFGYKGGSGDVYMMLPPDRFDKISRTLGKRPVFRSDNGVDQLFFEYRGCVFYLERSARR